MLLADFTLYHTGGWGGAIKQNDNDWKFQSYKGTNLGYDMICESIDSDQEEKEGDVLKVMLKIPNITPKSKGGGGCNQRGR